MFDVKIVLKKSMFLVIIAAIAVLQPFCVSAADASSTGGEYKVGDSVSVTVQFSADATLYAVEADLTFDPNVLMFEKGLYADYNLIEDGKVKIVDDIFYASKPASKSKYILKFTAIGVGSSKITVNLLGAGDGVSRASCSSNVIVTANDAEVAKGDVNGDGSISAKDLGVLMQYINGWNVTVVENASDVNADGNINAKDYGLLMQFINGWNVTLK